MNKVVFILLLSICHTSCSLPRGATYTEVGDNYEIAYACKHNLHLNVYSTGKGKKKLHGNIIRTHYSYGDSTIIIKYLSHFNRGLLDGPDSMFVNDVLYEINNYVKGVRHGDQIAVRDSTLSTTHYINGLADGIQKTFEHGVLSKESFFNHGIKDSLEHYYDSSGKLATTIHYYFYLDANWRSYLDLENHDLIPVQQSVNYIEERLNVAEYLGTIVFHSYDPKGIANPSPWEVLHESLAQSLYCDDPIQDRFFIIDENTCKVCDYIDKEGIVVAFLGAFSDEIAYFYLQE